MSSDDGNEEISWELLEEAVDFYDIAQFGRSGETRTYRLRMLVGGAELWRISETPGEPDQTIKERHFNNAEETGKFLEEMRRALRAGGWRELDS